MTATLPKKTRKRNPNKRRGRNRRPLRQRQLRLLKRIEDRHEPEREQPLMTATDIPSELAQRTHGLAAGGIGALFLLAQRTGLIRDIDRDLSLLKKHLPSHESDHVPTIALNLRAGGTRIEHIERLRHDAVFLDALGARRIPDPTTVGDFCRRFAEPDVIALMDTIDQAPRRVWAQQPPAFFDEAIRDVVGTLVGTDAECKRGIAIAYDGTWGYHPPVVSLADTAEPLSLIHRSGNRPSHEQAAATPDKMIDPCRTAGSRRITLRGDTDFTQTAHRDRGDSAGDIRCVFGIDARADLKARADDLPAEAYSLLERPPRYPIQTAPREKPERVKAPIVRGRGFETIHLLEERSAEFDSRPVACKRSDRVIVLRKRPGTDRGQPRLFEEDRYFVSITNDRTRTAEAIGFAANDRCDQENVIAQLQGGVPALTPPVDDLVSDWAYRVGARLAWTLKAWSAPLVPVSPRHAAAHEAQERRWLRMGFATFRAAVLPTGCRARSCGAGSG